MSAGTDASRVEGTSPRVLYELALAAGSSLDPDEACRRFLTTLPQHEQLSHAAVWLKPEIVGERSGHAATLFFAQPQSDSFRDRHLQGHPGFSLSADRPFVSVRADPCDLPACIEQVGGSAEASPPPCSAWATWDGSSSTATAAHSPKRRCWSCSADPVSTVAAALQTSGLPPRLLELELTESILLQDVENTLETVRQLKHLGVRLAIDDFGTGYSSLSYLRRFAVDKLKIDQSFVDDIGTDPGDAAIIRAVIQLARSLRPGDHRRGRGDRGAACLPA